MTELLRYVESGDQTVVPTGEKQFAPDRSLGFYRHFVPGEAGNVPLDCRVPGHIAEVMVIDTNTDAPLRRIEIIAGDEVEIEGYGFVKHRDV